MPPSRKFAPPRRSRGSHANSRHRATPPQSPPPLQPPLEWSAFGIELARRGSHFVSLALHVARAAACGGSGVTPEEEARLIEWFGGIVDMAIRRAGSDNDKNPAAAAIWHVLVGDWIASPQRARPPRCPAVAAVKRCPGEQGFLAALRALPASYVRTAIAGASASEVDDLRSLMTASDDELERWRPWGHAFEPYDTPAAEMIERAVSILALRHPSSADLCGVVQDWAHGFSSVVSEHTIPPVSRIGAIAWLARVALRARSRSRI
jgi:hypothetical protein